MVAGDVQQAVGVLDEEVVVVPGVGIEISALGIDRDFAQQPGVRELVQGIVDGGQRNLDAVGLGFPMEYLGRHMAVCAVEQEPGQGEALARGAQAGPAQAVVNVTVRRFHGFPAVRVFDH